MNNILFRIAFSRAAQPLDSRRAPYHFQLRHEFHYVVGGPAWLSPGTSGRRPGTHGRFQIAAATSVGQHHYRFLDTHKSMMGRSRIRFIDQDHLMRLVAAANLIPITWYGDWDPTPLTPTSREYIVVTCAPIIGLSEILY